MQSQGQNLVVNPSFEDTVSCPSAPGDIDKAEGWTSLCASPDYFNSCANSSVYGVPNNFGGYQLPASGEAYAGFLSYISSIPNLREFPACILSTPLNIGTKYYVSFKVALSLGQIVPSNLATNKISAMFTTGPHICYSLITNDPPVFTDSVITDSLNWTRITGSFIADSSYSHLVIGNFFNDANTDTLKLFDDISNQNNAYYYLDDVCVGTDSAFVYSYDYDLNSGHIENTFAHLVMCYPNPVTDYLTIQNEGYGEMEISIYNVQGKLLFSANNVSNNILKVNLSAVRQGILLVQIKTERQIANYKLLKL